MKICVYAICKNEEKFVKRWFDSMKEADEIYVLDTGSTDNTINKLKELGVHVYQEIITPWRFDVARNKSLELVPQDTDLCVCTDLDEVFEQGWREKIEKAGLCNQIKYNYIWSFDNYGKPAVNFFYEKIHSRNGYTWVNPVHEVLACSLEKPKVKLIENLTLKHYPDCSKSREMYLQLLELSVKENPNNDRNYHYLGREYMFHGMYEKAIETLKHHINMKEATWNDEKAASKRFISKCLRYQNKIEEALKYAIESIALSPYLREGYYETAFIYYLKKDYKRAIKYLELGLLIEKNPKIYINDPICYNGGFEDLLSICLYYEEDYKGAYIYALKALKYDKDNKRIKDNLKLFEEKI